MSPEESSYVDGLTIGDDALLWRRVPPKCFIYDENKQSWRPSSAVFDDHPDGSPMSVVLAQEALDAGRNAESILRGHEGFGLVCFTAGLAREQKQGIVRKPLPEEPAHAEVFGKKTKGVRRAFSKMCGWVVPPPAVH